MSGDRPRVAVYARNAAGPEQGSNLDDVRTDVAEYAERDGWAIEPVARDASTSRPDGAL